MELIHKIAKTLGERGASVVTAESCTGGLIGHLLTNVSGSSRWYLGGAVSYSNELKEALLGVEKEAFIRHGAVSAEVAEQMAAGARRAFGADYAISVTGIAGPGGGSEEKPVGLTYIGVATPDGVIVRRHVWQGGREGNKYSSARAALSLLLEALEGGNVPSGEEGVRDEAEEVTGGEEVMQESAAVEATFGVDGTIRPLAFVWKGQKLKIINWGRQWREGERRHFLVMTHGNRVWELSFVEEGLQWLVHPRTEPRYVV